MPIGIEDVRTIVQKYRGSVQIAGVLGKPLFVLLLGHTASEMGSEIRRLMSSRWSDAETHLSISSICFERNAQSAAIQEIADDAFEIAFSGVDESLIKMGLTQIIRMIKNRVKEKVVSLNDAEVCILSDMTDIEFSWAGACAMLFKYMIRIEETVQPDEAKLFCLTEGSKSSAAEMKEQLQKAAAHLELWEREIPKEKFLWAGDSRFEALDGLYVDKIFKSIMFMGRTDSQGVIYDRFGERLEMMVTFMDPCSRIPAADAENIFCSGYVYSNRLDMGFDLALLWNLCHTWYSQASYNETLATAANEAGRMIVEQYTVMQNRIALQMINDVEHNLITSQLDLKSAETKHDYLWIQQIQSAEFCSMIDRWKTAVRYALNSALDRDSLIAMENLLKIRCEDMRQEGRELSVFEVARVGSRENIEKINEHCKTLNKWLHKQVETQTAALYEKKGLIRARNQNVNNLMSQYAATLNNMGVASNQVMADRMKTIAARDDLVSEMKEEYAAQCSKNSGDNAVRFFMEEAAKRLMDHGYPVLEPIDLVPTQRVLGFRPAGPLQLNRGILAIGDGADQGRYYYLQSIPLDMIPGLPIIQENMQ